MQRSPHLLIWDDASTNEQVIDAAEMMRRLARMLAADFKEKIVRDEPRYELRRVYPGGFELAMIAGHIYDDREVLSVVIEVRAAALPKPITSVHLSGGIQRVKAARDVAWLRARNGMIVIVGDSLGGIVEVQH